MSKYQCHNRAPLRETVTVQSGWNYGLSDKYACQLRQPVMIEIPDPMSKYCQYQRDKKDDPKCQGCRWME